MDQKPVKRTGREGIPLPAHPPEKNNSSAGFGIETHCRLWGWNPQKKITTIVCFARILRELKGNSGTITCFRLDEVRLDKVSLGNRLG